MAKTALVVNRAGKPLLKFIENMYMQTHPTNSAQATKNFKRPFSSVMILMTMFMMFMMTFI